MKRLFVVVTTILLAGCDAPWAGPSLPNGAYNVNLIELSRQGPFGFGDPDIAAGTTLAQVRDQVLAQAAANGRSAQSTCQAEPDWPDPCWMRQAETGGRVYVAVIINYECNANSKDTTALSGRTLYLIHWVGNPGGPNGACTVARPNWRLYAASRRDLPNSGTLTVRLELQGSRHKDIDRQVLLG